MLLFNVLRWDPKKRITPDQASKHEWVQTSQVKTPCSQQPPSPLGAPHLPPLHAKAEVPSGAAPPAPAPRHKVEPPAFHRALDALVNKASAMTNSVSDLESAHQYSLYRLYHGKKTLAKLGTSNSVHQHGAMHHSQSTGDVSAMFGQAWYLLDVNNRYWNTTKQWLNQAKYRFMYVRRLFRWHLCHSFAFPFFNC